MVAYYKHHTDGVSTVWKNVEFKPDGKYTNH